MENTSSKNRIVIDYSGKQELVLLSIRDNETGNEFLSAIGFPIVTAIDTTIEHLLVEKNRPDFINKEGFVILFSNGFRVKVKYEEYFRLHKIMTGVNKKFVWEFLRDGKTKENLLVNVPDEFFQMVSKWETELVHEYTLIDSDSKNVFNKIFNTNESRKEFASKALQYKKYSSILFKMLEKKPYESIIWNMIEPTGECVKFSSYKKVE